MSASDESAGETGAKPDISDEEVDALLENVESGEGSAGMARSPGGVQPYNLIAPDKISRGRMPALDRINERWVGEFQQAVSELVRKPVEVTAHDAQVTAFGEWQSSLPAVVSLNVLSVSPWRGAALVALDAKLLFALVDSYYGGGGGGGARESVERANLTPAEERLNRVVVETLTRQFREAFEPIAAVQIEHQRTEVNPHYASIATSSEPVVVTRLDISLNEAGGAATLVLPLSVLEPVREKLAEDLKTVSPEGRARWRQGLRKQLEQMQLDLTSVFLRSELTMRELLSLKPGDILPIEMPRTTTLCAGDRALLRGKFGRSHGYNAVSIVETVPGNWPEATEEDSRP